MNNVVFATVLVVSRAFGPLGVSARHTAAWTKPTSKGWSQHQEEVSSELPR